jgi:hypothetical protein
MPKQKPNPEARSGWATYEIAMRNYAGELKIFPVFEELELHLPQAKPAVTKIQKVQDVGWPKARTQIHDDEGRRAIACVDKKQKPYIWLLKCKPSAWRLYFYVWEHPTNGHDKRIVYLHAIYKKQTPEDDGETLTARQRCATIYTGDSQHRQFFPFP